MTDKCLLCLLAHSTYVVLHEKQNQYVVVVVVVCVGVSVVRDDSVVPVVLPAQVFDGVELLPGAVSLSFVDAVFVFVFQATFYPDL